MPRTPAQLERDLQFAEKFREVQRKYYHANRDRVKELHKEYMQRIRDDPDKYANYRAKRTESQRRRRQRAREAASASASASAESDASPIVFPQNRSCSSKKEEEEGEHS